MCTHGTTSPEINCDANLPRRSIDHFDIQIKGLKRAESNILLVKGCHTASRTISQLNESGFQSLSSVTRLMGHRTTFQVHVGQSISILFPKGANTRQG